MTASKKQLDKIIKQASREIDKLPKWKRSADVQQELEKLEQALVAKSEQKIEHTWKEQLDQVWIDYWGDQIDPSVIEETFGELTAWNKKNVRRYLTKLEKLGATKIEIPDCKTIKLTLPNPADESISYYGIFAGMRDDILLHILTSSPKPSDVFFNKKTQQITLTWSY